MTNIPGQVPGSKGSNQGKCPTLGTAVNMWIIKIYFCMPENTQDPVIEIRHKSNHAMDFFLKVHIEYISFSFQLLLNLCLF